MMRNSSKSPQWGLSELVFILTGKVTALKFIFFFFTSSSFCNVLSRTVNSNSLAGLRTDLPSGPVILVKLK